MPADNLCAHSLAGFQKSFTVEHPGHFCMEKKSEIQQIEVRTGAFESKSKQNHERQVEKYITLEYLNRTIKQFPYKFMDKTDQPQIIPAAFASRGTIGDDGHENWALLRLLPLMIGFDIPENDLSWEILILLKDILELVTSFRFTEETIDFLGDKISEHRDLLLTVFPHFALRPKHHYTEH